MRPEIVFIVMGSFISATVRGEFNPRLSNSLPYYFLGGFFMIIGSMVFIGCPIKMLLRLSGGDITSISGIFGVFAGVFSGVMVLKEGVDTKDFAQKQAGQPLSSWLFIILLTSFFLLNIIKPGIMAESTSGAASERASLITAASLGLIIGVAAQYSRFCVTGAIRNSIILRNPAGYIALIGLTVSALVINLLTGSFNFGIYGQPGSHNEHLWSVISMFMVGYIAVIIDGCPFRQLIKSGEGDMNAQTAFMGMLFGGGVAQSFHVYSDASGPTLFGKIGTLAGIVIFAFITIGLRRKQ
jgi:YedE family putative selenium metabolism protein